MAKSTIALGYVHPDKVSAFFMSTIIRLLRREGHRIEEVIAVHSGPKIDDARNRLFKEWLLHTNANRFLMVDTDMVIPPDTIKRLIAHNKHIVGGLCFTGGWAGDYRPTLHVVKANDEGKPTMDILWNYPPNSLVEVDATGAACLMVTREAALEIWKARGEDHPLPWFAHGAHNGVVIGEDIAFCLTAAKVGYKTYVDTSLVIPHIKPYAIEEIDYVRALLNEDHPHYNERSEVPIYQELVDGNNRDDGNTESPERVSAERSA